MFSHKSRASAEKSEKVTNIIQQVEEQKSTPTPILLTITLIWWYAEYLIFNTGLPNDFLKFGLALSQPPLFQRSNKTCDSSHRLSSIRVNQDCTFSMKPQLKQTGLVFFLKKAPSAFLIFSLTSKSHHTPALHLKYIAVKHQCLYCDQIRYIYIYIPHITLYIILKLGKLKFYSFNNTFNWGVIFYSALPEVYGLIAND